MTRRWIDRLIQSVTIPCNELVAYHGFFAVKMTGMPIVNVREDTQL